MATALEQLRYIDEQLAAAALPPDQAELVRLHRLTGLQLRNQRLQELGPAPQAGTPEYADWEKCKKELEAQVVMSLAETRLSVEGLEESWEKWLHMEKLKAVREQLLQQTAAEGIVGDVRPPLQEGEADLSQPQGHLQDPAAWENLQIAPLQGPGGWDPQQQHAQLQEQEQQLQVHMQPPHDDSQNSAASRRHPPDVPPHHLQHQWDPLSHAQAQMESQQPLPPHIAPNEEGVAMKHCRRCNTHKPITQFYKSKANADGYDGRCKTCDAVQCAQRRKRKERIENPTVEWKACRRCGQNKAAAEFYRNKTNGDGLYNNCKACFTQDAHNRRERLPPLEERTAATKECRRCKETKAASEFYKNKHMSDGLYTHCKACYTEAANLRSAGRAPAETKRCRRCGTTKEAADFYVSKMTADGLQSYCKACYAVASAARRSRNNQEAELQTMQGARAQKEVDDYHQQAMQEHLMQGQLVDPLQHQVLQQQVMGVPQLSAGMDPALQAAQMQQMGYDPSMMQATLGDHALTHHGLEHQGHPGIDPQGLEHGHVVEQHHVLQHHLDPQALHHTLDHTGHHGGTVHDLGTGYPSHHDLEHHGLEHQPENMHDHQAYSHQHEHAVM